jgi:hypothetical protein
MKDSFITENELSHTSYFSKEFLTRNNTTAISPPTLLFCEGHHFETSEVIETESQVVLNTLTEHDYKDVFKKCQKLWEQCVFAEGDCFFKGDDGHYAKFCFLPYAPENLYSWMDGTCCTLICYAVDFRP